ncbi:MarR family transcriptional regulator [Psychrobacillus sp. FSL H8-0483]|uniref:MarR family winged helix-turn-helix transcriptional regulator n=1 Tax=Psychrobacillus sp. FSL H8-0483 TaxID=2921389 RepID=UPI00315B0042
MYSFFSKLKLIHRPYSNQTNEVLLPNELSEIQWGLIRYLSEIGPSTFTDVAAYWGVEKPSVTPIAQKLVEQEIIYISPGIDKRQKVMHLSPKGMEKYEQGKEAMYLFQAQLLEGVSQEEIKVAEQVLEKVRANLLRRG